MYNLEVKEEEVEEIQIKIQIKEHHHLAGCDQVF